MVNPAWLSVDPLIDTETSNALMVGFPMKTGQQLTFGRLSQPREDGILRGW